MSMEMHSGLDAALGHLTLSRRKGQAIKIGDRIEIWLIELSCDKARLRITAPKTMRVDPEEVAVLRAQAARIEERRRRLDSGRGAV